MAHHDDYVILYKPYGWLTHDDHTQQRPNVHDYMSQQLSTKLAIHQRLDVSTSGVFAMSHTTKGHQILSHALQKARCKVYLAVVEGVINVAAGDIKGPVPQQPQHAAHSTFKVIRRGSNWTLVELTLHTGRTHQLRAHLACYGYPIRGDGLYGNPFDLRAPRCLLHAYQLTIENTTFTAPIPVEFLRYTQEQPNALDIKSSLYQAQYNECYRCVHGQSDQAPGWRIDRYLDWYWIIRNRGTEIPPWIQPFLTPHKVDCKGVYLLDAQIDRSQGQQSKPHLLWGEPAPQTLVIHESGIQYHVVLADQLSTGLFLDQRPQRAWIHGLKDEIHDVLNTFAHAGGFSIAAALAGARTVSIDLSKKWLARIPPQLEQNGIKLEGHECISGDVFDWLKRLAKKNRQFDLIILDPPSTSIGSTKKRWSAKKDYPELVALTLPLLKPRGRLLTATNHRQLSPQKFAYMIRQALPHDFELERVCPPALDFAGDEIMGIKNLIWRKKS